MCQKPMRSTASFLSSVRFVSDAVLLRSLLCLVCRSSDSSIQAARLIAACDLAPYCQRIASAFSPGHDSPSNDRFSPHAGISRMENNTLESQLLSESCRTACNLKCADCRSCDGFLPCPGFTPDSLVQRTSMRVRFAARDRVKAFTLTKPLRCFGSRMCHKSHGM